MPEALPRSILGTPPLALSFNRNLRVRQRNQTAVIRLRDQLAQGDPCWLKEIHNENARCIARIGSRRRNRRLGEC
jgi:hypothetical protein